METSTNTILVENTAKAENAHFGIVVDSIGTTGVGLVQALKKISPLSENKIAALLFQTPSMLFSGLPEQAAKEINGLLLSTGLESRVVHKDEPFEPGDSGHEVALVINDFEHIQDIAKEIIAITGLGIDEIRQLLCKSPTVMLGKISQNTALVIQQRFKAFNVAVDISKPDSALFDVFKGTCSAYEQGIIEQMLNGLGVEWNKAANYNVASLLCGGISRPIADKLWQQTSRTSLPIKIVNRDFERFDLRLDQAPDTPEMMAYLAESTGMPEKIAQKVVRQLPIILHKNIRFDRVDEEIGKLNQLGAVSSAHLLVFQSFSLKIQAIKDLEGTLEVLKVVGGIDKGLASQSILEKQQLDGPFTSPQVRWLQHELKRIGTITSRILR
ncbi:MAG: hypothetical protein KDD02_26250 [Phaeodactylibacter sp.]|nr:hypothetical protein [Phaeodactylibacter sp.]MCB9299219.1 hypothetical protein [Lewinellaceae bacterium]